MTADYSQIEMRIMAHLSGDEGLIEAFTSGEDLHSFVASRAFDIPIEDVDPEMRRRIKAMSYGLAYGLSAYGLSQQLRITPEEARGQMHAYFERFGGIRDYLDTVVEEARLTGYTETTLGRRRYLPDLTSDNRQRREMAERMALNAPIQGSAADVIKVAMLNVEKAIAAEGLPSRMLLQVHDELVLEVAPGEREELEALVRREMAGAADLSVRWRSRSASARAGTPPRTDSRDGAPRSVLPHLRAVHHQRVDDHDVDGDDGQGPGRLGGDEGQVDDGAEHRQHDAHRAGQHVPGEHAEPGEEDRDAQEQVDDAPGRVVDVQDQPVPGGPGSSRR